MKKKKKMIIAFVLLNFIALTVSFEVYASDPLTDISKSLICSCGCAKVVYDCYCDLAKQWRNQISEDLAAGKTKQQIINGFVEIYGDQVLATPKKSGLELTIWTIPLFASILGTVIIYQYAKKKSPMFESEIGAPILDPSEVTSEGDEIESTLMRYNEIYYKEYQKARKQKEQV